MMPGTSLSLSAARDHIPKGPLSVAKRIALLKTVSSTAHARRDKAWQSLQSSLLAIAASLAGSDWWRDIVVQRQGWQARQLKQRVESMLKDCDCHMLIADEWRRQAVGVCEELLRQDRKRLPRRRSTKPGTEGGEPQHGQGGAGRAGKQVTPQPASQARVSYVGGRRLALGPA